MGVTPSYCTASDGSTLDADDFEMVEALLTGGDAPVVSGASEGLTERSPDWFVGATSGSGG